jgi:hypothetical protein
MKIETRIRKLEMKFIILEKIKYYVVNVEPGGCSDKAIA